MLRQSGKCIVQKVGYCTCDLLYYIVDRGWQRGNPCVGLTCISYTISFSEADRECSVTKISRFLIESWPDMTQMFIIRCRVDVYVLVKAVVANCKMTGIIICIDMDFDVWFISVTWQLGLVEREINSILHGYAAKQPQQVQRPPRPGQRPQFDGSGGTVGEREPLEQRPIGDDDVCPICQDELLSKHLPVTFCKWVLHYHFTPIAHHHFGPECLGWVSVIQSM